MLRLALLENLRRVAARVMAGRRERERAGYWVERMLDVSATEPAKVVLVLAKMIEEDPPLTSAFVAELASRLHGQGPALIVALTWLEQRLAEQGQSVDNVFQQASQNQAADQVSIGNSIGSLRFLGAADWRSFVESISVVEQALRQDPAGVYHRMDFATRDHYRHAVEDVAKRSGIPEVDVAGIAVELALAAKASRAGDGEAVHTKRRAHVGYFLVDRGRSTLDRAARIRTTPGAWLRRRADQFRLPLYLGSILLTTMVTTGLLLIWAAHRSLGLWSLTVMSVVLAVCASQLAVALIHWAATLLLRPATLPRMNFSSGIPPEHRTVVAVPTMLTDRLEVGHLLEALEVRFLANQDENVSFALLTDFRDSSHQTMPDDETLLQQAREGIEALNAKYSGGEVREGESAEDERIDTGIPKAAAKPRGGGFFLFHRARRWNAQEGVWMGWERKRGKLEEFNAALSGKQGEFDTVAGPIDRLRGVKYVITLDADTQLPRDSAQQLAGTMAHPLNRPFYDEKRGRVTEGYSILQPRIGISMSSAARSPFARLFGGDPGIDPYTRAVSDVYQDVFHEGSFIGKGIYDLEAIQRALGGRFPENRILSHDLLEGAYGRCGLVSDVLLFEDYPPAYPADVSRRYRWIRGDWQIATWLLPWAPGLDSQRVSNPISALSRWKILDNLRRSLVPPALLALLLFGWFGPGTALFGALVVIGTFALPALLTAAAELARRSTDIPMRHHWRLVARSFARQFLREAFAIAALPYDALIHAQAIGRTAIRVLVTRRNLLEWQTARDAQRRGRTDLGGFYLSLWVLPTTAILAGGALAVLRVGALVSAGPLLGIWLLAPAVAWWLSRLTRPALPRLAEEDSILLSMASRLTWRFFEIFVTEVDNYLPPDNFQQDPPRGVAHRTSPTNIGLSVLANLAAYDFGFISGGGLINRTAQTLASIDKMQRYRGHLYNWYDTRTLEPLRPLYVSTVDSGNFAGHLLILAAALKQFAGGQILTPTVFTGLAGTLYVIFDVVRQGNAAATLDVLARLTQLRDQLSTTPQSLSASHRLLRDLLAAAEKLTRAIESDTGEQLKSWVRAFENQCRESLDDLKRLAPWLEMPPPSAFVTGGASAAQAALLRRLDEVPTLAQTAKLEAVFSYAFARETNGERRAWPAEEENWLSRLRDAVVRGSERAAQRLSDLERLADRCGELADVDYEFLYDQDRHLLAIGYNVDDHRRDASYYDLLASEARLASFVAIAQGKLPQEHWFSLGRVLTTSGGQPALLSWSGSMFEYLMPLLVMPTYDGTLLDETYKAVVERQIAYGRERGVPWGISESGYAKTDAQLNYQYRAFGVPGLGFKRGLADDLVVAPYASAMALMIDPRRSCANLRRLASDRRLGDYGFYEAVDYTPARQPPGQDGVVVRSFMAHHQGMALLSFPYVLLDRPMQHRFESEPLFRATELLLQERVPKTASVYPHPAEVSESRGIPLESGTNFRTFNTPQTPSPEVHLLSNGRYHVAVTAAGGGYSRWRDLAITRWHEDPTRDCWGTLCYLRDAESGEFWSAAHQPVLKRAASYEAIFSPGRAEVRAATATSVRTWKSASRPRTISSCAGSASAITGRGRARSN